MCDLAVCISLHYTSSLQVVFCLSTPALSLERVAFEMCQEIMIRSVLLLLQFGPHGTDFTSQENNFGLRQFFED